MYNKIAFILLFVLLALPVSSQVAFKKGGKWGYKDEKGRVIVQPIYEEARDFRDGLGNVKRMGWWGYINKFGKVIIPFSFDESYSHKDGVASTRKGYKWGFIDRYGNTIIDFQYEQARNFCEGLAAVKKNNRWGYIDRNGSVIVPIEYDFVMDFHDGLAAVKNANKWGFIDLNGMGAIPFIYDETFGFSNGYAAVRVGNKWGYIDLNGENVIECKYDFVTNFKNGLADAQLEGKDCVIDMNGVVYKNKKVALKNYSGVKEVKRTVTSSFKTSKQYEATEIVEVSVGESFSAFAKKYVEKKIQKWQTKDEFEKTSDYHKRVNESTRNAKINEYTEEAKEMYIKKHSSSLSLLLLLGDYDADNEVFMMRERHFGNLLVKVPLNEAKEFKDIWNSVKTKPTYGVANDRLALDKVVFTLPSGKEYTYNNDDVLKFSIAQIEYNFEPIEIEQQKKTVNQSNIVYTSVNVGKSDVDVNLPQREATNVNTFAVVIANENYQSEAKVEYALNDGDIFAEYCNKVLGIPQDNIMLKKDATLNNIRSAVSWLKMVTDAYKGKASVIFYYAGHGVPNEVTRQSYMLPIDGESANIETAYSLGDLYNTLGNLNVGSTIVFLDACFSGAQRGEKMLASARATAIKPRELTPKGKTIVFAATHGEQTAMPYREKSHGLFTYFLLKKLKETRGDVTMGELKEYVSDEVNKLSTRINKKNQTPTLIPSYNMNADWDCLKLIENKLLIK